MSVTLRRLFSAALVVLGLTVSHAPAQEPRFDPPPVPDGIGDALVVNNAIDAYVYGYSLVFTAVTRTVTTNVPAPTSTARAPINQFGHQRTFPTADSTDFARPNTDTLYSFAWLDLSKEPIILHVPDTQGRFYVMEILDAWTNVFADPGKRTTGTGEHAFALLGPGWKGTLPQGVTPIQSPTTNVWIVGRTQTNGTSDYAAVNAIQDQYTLTPLSAWGTNYTPPTNPAVNPSIDMTTAPVKQVTQMSATTFFQILAQQMKTNPPAPQDTAAVENLARFGIVPGQDFDPSRLDPATASALAMGSKLALAKIYANGLRLGVKVNGWKVITQGIGAYGTDYLTRATIAMTGPAANLPDDAIYPTASEDGDHLPLSGEHQYVIHFDPGQTPPANAFWSITLYNQQSFLVANPINRYALHNWDPLTYNADGSLDLYLQNQSPGADKEANWLPTPEGIFNLTLRLYWPKPEALNGSWQPPAIKRGQ
jgi:hypothetical protein